MSKSLINSIDSMFTSIIARLSHKRVFIAFGHLHASLLIGAGIDPTTVSGILGHSQVSTTLNIYSHMFQENQAKACDAVATALKFSKNKSVDNNANP